MISIQTLLTESLQEYKCNCTWYVLKLFGRDSVSTEEDSLDSFGMHVADQLPITRSQRFMVMNKRRMTNCNAHLH